MGNLVGIRDRLRRIARVLLDGWTSHRVDMHRDQVLSRVWDDEVMSTHEAARSLRAIGAHLEQVPVVSPDIATTLIKVCVFFRSRGLTRTQINTALAAAVLQSVAPWTVKKAVKRATHWDGSLEQRPREADLTTFGRFLADHADELTRNRLDGPDTEHLLMRMSRGLPSDAGLPDSCADEPTEVPELLVRLHTLIDNSLDAPFRRQRMIALLFAAVGVGIVVLSIWLEAAGGKSVPPFFGVTVGLWLWTIAGASFARTLVVNRLDRWSLATARTTAHSLTGMVTIAVAIIGFWTITEQPPGFTVAGVALLIVMVSASVCAEHIVALGDVRLAELLDGDLVPAGSDAR
ncbi:hypothetical protein ACVKXF_002838 [Curtobacterium sp. PvP017]